MSNRISPEPPQVSLVEEGTRHSNIETTANLFQITDFNQDNNKNESDYRPTGIEQGVQNDNVDPPAKYDPPDPSTRSSTTEISPPITLETEADVDENTTINGRSSRSSSVVENIHIKPKGNSNEGENDELVQHRLEADTEQGQQKENEGGFPDNNYYTNTGGAGLYGADSGTNEDGHFGNKDSELESSEYSKNKNYQHEDEERLIKEEKHNTEEAGEVLALGIVSASATDKNSSDDNYNYENNPTTTTDTTSFVVEQDIISEEQSPRKRLVGRLPPLRHNEEDRNPILPGMSARPNSGTGRKNDQSGVIGGEYNQFNIDSHRSKLKR